MAVNTGCLLKTLLIGVISGAIIDFVIGTYSARLLSMKKSRFLVVLTAIFVALLPILAGRTGAEFHPLWKATWGEVFLMFSLIDLGSRRVPNDLVLLFTMVGLASSLAGIGPSLQSSIYGLVFGIFFFLVPAVLWKGGMGLGDVKFAGMSGAVIGFPAIFWASMWGLVLGGMVALILLLTGRVSRKGKFPYVPPLAAGMWLYMLFML